MYDGVNKYSYCYEVDSTKTIFDDNLNISGMIHMYYYNGVRIYHLPLFMVSMGGMCSCRHQTSYYLILRAVRGSMQIICITYQKLQLKYNNLTKYRELNPCFFVSKTKRGLVISAPYVILSNVLGIRVNFFIYIYILKLVKCIRYDQTGGHRQWPITKYTFKPLFRRLVSPSRGVLYKSIFD